MKAILLVGLAATTGSVSSAAAQAGNRVVEIPLLVVSGRLMVTVDGPHGTRHDFVLGLGPTLLTRTGAARIGAAKSRLAVGGVPVSLESAVTVADAELAGGGVVAAGVLGGETLNRFDALIDVPNGRLVLKPVGRAVRWDGVPLSNPVAVRVFHDVLIRVDIEVGGKLFGGLLDLTSPGLEVNAALRAAANIRGDRVDSFRMGYAGWPDLPVRVVDSPVIRRWDGQGAGFAIIGAAVAHDCAIAVSWAHSELRTCLR